MTTEVKEKAEKKVKPKFRNPNDMTKAELNDPDYRLKQLMKQAKQKGASPLTCSKCHHCR